MDMVLDYCIVLYIVRPILKYGFIIWPPYYKTPYYNFIRLSARFNKSFLSLATNMS